MRLTPLKLSDRERVDLAHRLWSVRRDCLLLVPLMPSWSSRLFDSVRTVMRAAEVLMPDLGGDDDAR